VTLAVASAPGEDTGMPRRAFLDQIAGPPDPLPPNASFADGLRTMEIIRAVVQSSQAGGASVPVR